MERKAYKGTESYIFASYSHWDMAEVQEIIAQMQRDGFRVWYDEGIDPGTEWDDNIADHIQKCGYLIAFISQNYIDSENCKDELNYARDLDKKRLLVYLEQTELPPGMAMRLNRQQSIHRYKYDDSQTFYGKLYEASGIQEFSSRDETEVFLLTDTPQPVCEFKNLMNDDSEARSIVLKERYRVDSLVGEGNFGKVYKGYDLYDEKNIAIKIINDKYELASSAKTLRVLPILHNIDNPFICHLCDYFRIGLMDTLKLQSKFDGLSPGSFCLIEEYIEGITLENYIRINSSNIQERVNIGSCIIFAIMQLNREGLLHCDLAPTNIMIEENEEGVRVVLIDLESTCSIESNSMNGLKQSFVLHMPFVAPESLKNSVLTSRSQVYSLGVILYYLLTNYLPKHVDEFVFGEEEMKRLRKSLRNTGLADVYINIIRKAVAYNENERYSSVTELLGELE